MIGSNVCLKLPLSFRFLVKFILKLHLELLLQVRYLRLVQLESVAWEVILKNDPSA